MTVPELVGSYVIEEVLGRGGMGVVHAASHRILGHRAAIKLLRPELAAGREHFERFFDEARAANKIAHPGIVEIWDVGFAEDGRPYLAMELLDGESLAQRLRRGPLPVPTAVEVGRQIADALAAAHAAGIVHRDLKPDNVFVTAAGRIKLFDFGIAKLTAGERKTRTATGAMLGTPHYMSPEQCAGAKDVDHRADLYALGCVLFRMLTGAVPFDAEEFLGVIGMHQHDPAPALRARCPAAPAALDAIVARLLAKAPGDRYQTAAEVRDALAALDVGEPGLATTPASTSAPASADVSSAPSVEPLGATVASLVPSPRIEPLGATVASPVPPARVEPLGVASPVPPARVEPLGATVASPVPPARVEPLGATVASPVPPPRVERDATVASPAPAPDAAPAPAPSARVAHPVHRGTVVALIAAAAAAAIAVVVLRRDRTPAASPPVRADATAARAAVTDAPPVTGREPAEADVPVVAAGEVAVARLADELAPLLARRDCAAVERSLERFDLWSLYQSSIARAAELLYRCELRAGRHALTPDLIAMTPERLLAAGRDDDALTLCFFARTNRYEPSVACGVAACRTGHALWARYAIEGDSADPAIVAACAGRSVALQPDAPVVIGPGLLDLGEEPPVRPPGDAEWDTITHDLDRLEAAGDCAGLERYLGRFSSLQLRNTSIGNLTQKLYRCETAAGRLAITPALKTTRLGDLVADGQFADALAVCLWLQPTATPEGGGIYPVACGVAACRAGHVVWARKLTDASPPDRAEVAAACAKQGITFER